MKQLTKANASDSNCDMNVNLELEVDNNFRFAITPDKEINILKDIRLEKKMRRSSQWCVNLFKLYLMEKG